MNVIRNYLGFTLHFATINTMEPFYPTPAQVYLHYTLLLLIPLKYKNLRAAFIQFTLHFATINTKKIRGQYIE